MRANTVMPLALTASSSLFMVSRAPRWLLIVVNPGTCICALHRGSAHDTASHPTAPMYLPWGAGGLVVGPACFLSLAALYYTHANADRRRRRRYRSLLAPADVPRSQSGCARPRDQDRRRRGRAGGCRF